MLFAAGAASSAIDLLSSLLPSSKAGVQPTKGGSFSVNHATGIAAPSGAVSGNGPQLSPATFSSLLALQGQAQPVAAGSSPLQDLFSLIDGDGNGQISKSEFENALGAGSNLQTADDVFSKMDRNGDGDVSLDEMASALKGLNRGHHHRHAAGKPDSDNADPLMQALEGASSASTTRSDGSATTPVTAADGTTVTMAQPAAASTSTMPSTNGKATSPYYLVERMIQRHAAPLALSTKQSLSVSV